ncbi:MAG: hypothetical protein HZC28_03120 [Spirochaetes bacterium]|nr:hypothetical protein [Spirochaetota bacterium]
MKNILCLLCTAVAVTLYSQTSNMTPVTGNAGTNIATPVSSNIIPETNASSPTNVLLTNSIGEPYRNSIDALAAEASQTASGPEGIIERRMRIAALYYATNDFLQALSWYAWWQQQPLGSNAVLPPAVLPSDHTAAWNAFSNSAVTVSDVFFVISSRDPSLGDTFASLAETFSRVSSRIVPATDTLLYFRGMLHYLSGDYGPALASLNAVTAKSSFPLMDLMLGLSYLSSLDTAKAFSYLRRAAAESDRAALMYNRALIRYRDGKTEAAYRDLIDAERIRAGAPEIYYNIGTIYRQNADMQKAKYYFEKALAADSTYALPAYALGVIHLELEQYETAMALFQRTESNTSGRGIQGVKKPYLYNNMAICRLKSKKADTAEALVFAEKAVTEYPAAFASASNETRFVDPRIYETKAVILAARKDYTNAIIAIDAALASISNIATVSPNNPLLGASNDYLRQRKDWSR